MGRKNYFHKDLPFTNIVLLCLEFIPMYPCTKAPYLFHHNFRIPILYLTLYTQNLHFQFFLEKIFFCFSRYNLHFKNSSYKKYPFRIFRQIVLNPMKEARSSTGFDIKPVDFFYSPEIQRFLTKSPRAETAAHFLISETGKKIPIPYRHSSY